MKYTTEQRKQLKAAFEAALPHLALSHTSEGVKYISDCLGVAYVFGEITLEGQHLAADLIKERLGGSESLDSWLIEKNIVPRNEVSHDCIYSNRIKIQATRKAWLESLIEEFS
jgi:hypothetical protein